ncbi:MAG: cupin domain-containing protein [Rhodospirillales bacterium]|jgi:quercetin dioxygenase-like cupin family protein|nr:cupin domain-containing protein [Rhodospirillales bacterium]MDP6772651.1 cupin domain-containing protein [Rhodospirillales bacterium]
MTSRKEAKPETGTSAAGEKGVSLVVEPDDGRSFWQPEPANGYVIIKVEPRNTGVGGVSMSVQAVGVGGYVREHAHGENDEIIYVLEGKGTAVVDGERHPMVPGTTIFLGKCVKHTFINEGDGELRFIATILPAGLEDYFEAVGRPRRAGEAAPQPFPRPDNVLEIERNTVFKDPK